MLAAPGQLAPLGMHVLRTHRDASAYLPRLSSQVRMLGAVAGGVALSAWLYRRGQRALRDVEEVEGGRATRRPGLGRPLHESERARRAMAVALGLGVVLTLLPPGSGTRRTRRPEVVILGGAEGSAEPWPFSGDWQLAASPEFRVAYRVQRVPLAGFEFVYFLRTDVPAPAGG